MTKKVYFSCPTQKATQMGCLCASEPHDGVIRPARVDGKV